MVVAPALVLLVPSASAEIYKWVDAQGNVHFGDKPLDTKDASQAKPVELRNSYTPTERSAQEQAVYERERLATKQRLEAEKATKERASKERPEKPRAAKPRRNAADDAPDEGLERFRIEVGLEHGVKPGNIVGAISNEAELDSEHIGRIIINDDHSTVDLPEGMPKELFKHLKGVWVSGQKMQISRLTPAKAPRKKPPTRKKPKINSKPK